MLHLNPFQCLHLLHISSLTRYLLCFDLLRFPVPGLLLIPFSPWLFLKRQLLSLQKSNNNFNEPFVYYISLAITI